MGMILAKKKVQYNRGTGKHTPLANMQFAADWSDPSNPGRRADQWGTVYLLGVYIFLFHDHRLFPKSLTLTFPATRTIP